jgi:hypothetical protein
VALQHPTGAIMIIAAQGLGVTDAAHGIETLTDISQRHRKLADRDRRKLLWHLHTADAGHSEQRLNLGGFYR